MSLLNTSIHAKFVQLIEEQVISLICILKLLDFVFWYHTLVQFTCRNFFFEGWTACRIFYLFIFSFFCNFPLQEFFFWELSPPPPVIFNGPPLNVFYKEITSWLVGAYDFYSRVVKIRKRTSERSERVSLANLNNEWIKIVQANQPWSNLSII